MSAASRLLADSNQTYDSDYVNNDKNFNWQREMNEGYHGKPRTPGQTLPEGTFTKSASEIAHILKQHSDSYAQAMSKLSSYINRSGRNLQGEEKARLYDAKNALRNAYGEPSESAEAHLMNNGNATIGFDESRIGMKHGETASSEIPIYGLPPGHNMDDGYLPTGIDGDSEEGPVEPVADPGVPELNAMSRLLIKE